MSSIQDVAKGGFSDPQFLVLASLAGGPKHGHAMLADIEAMIGVRLGPGTLYGAIGKLEVAGWIERLPGEDRRKPYQLTAGGLLVFRRKVAVMQQIVAVAGPRSVPA